MIAVALVDHGLGNLYSVAKALEAVGARVTLASHPEELKAADRIVLPGQGAFGDAAKSLGNAGFPEALDHEVRTNGKPYLGICLGMQLLGEESSERGTHSGLGWLSGSVDLLPTAIGLRMPHMGWDDVALVREHSLFSGLGKAPCFYFAHSYALRPDDATSVAATCDYGDRFAAAVIQKNVAGVQFHPEKSQELGLRFLENFLAWRP